jgi:hypothetical protein
MPSLDGATEWVNSDPLGPAEQRGHVVLVKTTLLEPGAEAYAFTFEEPRWTR